MEIQFFRTGVCSYVCRAHRDDGTIVQFGGPGGRFNPPHDYAHYLVERVYAPAHGFWGVIAAGALWGDMQLLAGRRPPHSAERTRRIRRLADEAHSDTEGLVIAFQKITDGGLDRDWRSAQEVLNWCVDYRTASRPHSLEEIERMCAEFRHAAQRWSAVRVGESITVQWRTVLSGRDRRFAPRKKHAHRN